MSLRRRDWLLVLREFDLQDHDWICVELTSQPDRTEHRRRSAFKALNDLGLVEVLNRRSFSDGHGFPLDPDGKPILSEVTYRITAAGRAAKASLVNKVITSFTGWFRKAIYTVLVALFVSWVVWFFGPGWNIQGLLDSTPNP